MRHLKRGRKLNRTPEHRKAMVRNIARSLFIHGRITTTPEKAKETRAFAEKLITLAKEGTLAARRRAIMLLHDKIVVKQLFEDIAPRYTERNGGYTRILRLASRRLGDAAHQAIFELVEAEISSDDKKTVRKAAVANDDKDNAEVVNAEIVNEEESEKDESEAESESESESDSEQNEESEEGSSQEDSK